MPEGSGLIGRPDWQSQTRLGYVQPPVQFLRVHGFVSRDAEPCDLVMTASASAPLERHTRRSLGFAPAFGAKPCGSQARKD